MGKITDIIRSGKILISDGAWGTFLQQTGLGPGECPELWNTEKPDAVFKIAKSYIDAGADIIGANCGNGIEGMIQITSEIRKSHKHIPV